MSQPWARLGRLSTRPHVESTARTYTSLLLVSPMEPLGAVTGDSRLENEVGEHSKATTQVVNESKRQACRLQMKRQKLLRQTKTKSSN